jgi:hypothetical protein
VASARGSSLDSAMSTLASSRASPSRFIIGPWLAQDHETDAAAIAAKYERTTQVTIESGRARGGAVRRSP